MVNMYFAVFACKVTKKVLNTSKKGEKKAKTVNVQWSMFNGQWSMFNGLLRVTFTFQFVSLAKKKSGDRYSHTGCRSH